MQPFARFGARSEAHQLAVNSAYGVTRGRKETFLEQTQTTTASCLPAETSPCRMLLSK